MPSTIAKSRIVVSNANKLKRIAFCGEMLEKSDEELGTIWFGDETMVKSRRNGEVVLFKCPPGAEWFVPSNGGTSKSVMFWGLI